jgi:hypothetical protein
LAGLAGLWVLAVVAVLVLPSSWTSRRPPDAELLQRHLGLESTNGFSRIEVKYQPAREWSAWFHLQATPERLSQLLAYLRFKEIRASERNDLIRMVTLNAESSSPVDPGVKLSEKQPPGEILWHYAVQSADGTELWFWVLRP